ncbi:hypothetical protein LCGC14_2174850 [marine sediment metagenome]|uniref:Uncharacterized protein n=1 Tax=marine sediment metagenome TaxID=412755 RepID=A0A0F9EB78_9ZZZZ
MVSFLLFFVFLVIFFLGGRVLGINKKTIGEFFFGKKNTPLKIEKNVGETEEKIELITDEKDKNN